MSLQTNLTGRLRNTDLPKTNALFPLFEAVINSIHAIDERKSKMGDSFEGEINVKINRSGQQEIDKNEKQDIVGFEIVDNGIGFNSDNYLSFQTLDSEYKIDKGCRGIGRLLWLKAFNKVTVNSIYTENSHKKKIKFDFDKRRDIHNESFEEVESEETRQTKVKLNKIQEDYGKYLPKGIETIGYNLLEHCLWYFLREGGAPIITLEDGQNKISLDSLYDEYMLNASDTETLNLKSYEFFLTHVKLKSRTQNKHSILYSAADRVVKEESLTGKIPGLFGVLNDGEDDFTYMCFVSSPYLTEKVHPERFNFKIPENLNGVFRDEEISFHEIRGAVLSAIKKYLDSFLQDNKEKGIERLTNYIDTKAPRYRPILGRISEEDQIVDPNISDKDLEVKLHSHLVEIERQLLTEGHELMSFSDLEDEESYTKQVEEYLSKASDLKKSDLANYVTHRRVIIDLLSRAIKIKEDGKYQKEEILHKLIMPMQVESNEIVFDDSNLWLIDERLAFHNYLASDKTIKSMPITKGDETKEPDLIALNIYDNPLLVNEGESLPLASITVIEIKRPMRNDAKAGEEKDPIEQALGYLKRVRNGEVTTSAGRLIPDSEKVPGFCYVITDITSKVKARCDFLDLQVTADKLGYFGYHKKFNAYIEVISYDRLLTMAKERNRAFFDKLGLPSN
jgi:hypothetical protein